MVLTKETTLGIPTAVTQGVAAMPAGIDEAADDTVVTANENVRLVEQFEDLPVPHLGRSASRPTTCQIFIQIDSRSRC